MYEIAYTMDETMQVYLEVVHQEDLEEEVISIEQEGGMIVAINPIDRA